MQLNRFLDNRQHGRWLRFDFGLNRYDYYGAIDRGFLSSVDDATEQQCKHYVYSMFFHFGGWGLGVGGWGLA